MKQPGGAKFYEPPIQYSALILSMVFFYPGYNFPFPPRDGIIIMKNLEKKKKEPQWKNK